MKVAILGATKGMGREVARKLAARGDQLVLLGRDASALEAMVVDLKIRGAGQASWVPCDLADASTFAPALDGAESALGHLDAVVVTAGLFGTQDNLESNLDFALQVLDVNLTKTVIFCEHARKRLTRPANPGRLVVFSSVAGDRGRKTVGLYGASKAGLSHYLDALDHKYRSYGLITICVKPGFVRTGMTDGLKEPPFAGEPEQVAVDVIRAMDRGTPLIYTPRIWQAVMLVIKHLPRFVMRKVGF